MAFILLFVVACSDVTIADFIMADAPTWISSFGSNQITDLAVGTNHMIAVNTTGEVFTWGCGDDGQLGHGYVHFFKFLIASAFADHSQSFVFTGTEGIDLILRSSIISVCSHLLLSRVVGHAKCLQDICTRRL